MRVLSKEEQAKIRSQIGEFVPDLIWQPPPKAMALFKSLDNPPWVPASQAGHMRDDDYVLGIKRGDRAYAVPIYIVDAYHSINATLEDTPVFLAS